jgi:serine/threonine protein phosphatase PrpC
MYDVIQVKGLNLKVSTPLSLYGVFDGHGGKKCAEYTKAHLCRNIIANLENGQDASHALTAAYIKTDTDFCTSHSVSENHSVC